MVVVSAILAVAAISAVVMVTVVRGLAAAHRQEYREDMSALAFASAPQMGVAKRKQSTPKKRTASPGNRPARNQGRTHSTLALR